MIYLDNYIKETINPKITGDLSNFFVPDNLVKLVERGTSGANIDKDNNPILFDSRKDYYMYHRLRTIRPEVLRQKGKTKQYDNIADLELVIYTTDRGFWECIQNKLSELKDVTLQETDFDSYSIIRKETDWTSYDISSYIYVVNYQIRFKSTQCVSYTCS